MSVDLLFKSQPVAAPPTGLVFGAAEIVTPDPVYASVTAAITPISLAAAVRYDNRVTRYLHNAWVSPHQSANSAEARPSLSWRSALSHKTAKSNTYEVGVSRCVGTAIDFWQANGRPRNTISPYEVGLATACISQVNIETALSVKLSNSSTFETALAVDTSARLLNEVAVMLTRRPQGLHEVAHAAGFSFGALAGSAKRTGAALEFAPWEVALRMMTGLSKRITTVVPPLTLYAPSTHLLFQCPPAQSWHLLFGSHPCQTSQPLPAGPFAIPAARYYMSFYSVYAQLLPTLVEVPLYPGVTISQDVGSYGWTFSAQGPASLYSQLAAIPGQPRQLMLTINGLEWLFMLDSPKMTQSFGNMQVQITGRSVTAVLGSGFARERASTQTQQLQAQQIAALVLENTGISLDWGIEDWLVPADVWSHLGTPLAAVQSIAEAAGGYVQSHRSLPELQVRHPYPLLPGGLPGGPWNWSAVAMPDVVLSADAIISRSVEVRQNAALNAVYVSGTDQGVLALVKRQGTAGNDLATMIVDPLMTTAIAAQQRGLAVLGAAGPKLMHQLELPVLTGQGQPGVLNTGQLVEVADPVPWRGRVRAVSVRDARPSIRQSILVEAA